MSILNISKTLMYEFWYAYMKLKYGDNVKLCYKNTDSLIINIKTENFYQDIASDVETKFHTSSYEIEFNSIDTPLPTGKNKKVIGPMKYELGGRILTELYHLDRKLIHT